MRAVRKKLRIAILAACLLGAIVVPGRASAAVALEPVGTFSAPIFVTAPPGDPRLFVVERAGRIQVVKNGVTEGTPFLDIHTQTTIDGERGLLSMAFDPNYASNGLFYVFYTDSGPPDGTLGDGQIDEFHVSSNPDVADASSQRHVLTIGRPLAGATNHNGGQLQFGPGGYLYVSVGDGGTGGAPAHDLTVLNGKMLRIDPHGATPGAYTIPSDNPFFGSLSARNEIWAIGLRNPWRFSVDHLDGSLLIGDVGESAREEVDYSPASTGFGRGADYGWNCREGFIAGPGGCGGGSYTDPIFDYPHTDPGGGAAFGCAITGGYVYRGTQVPELAGRYVYADLCQAALRSLVPGLPLGSGERSEGVSIGANPVSFGEDGNCELYLATINTDHVYRIVSSAAPPVSPACPPPPAPGGQQPLSGVQPVVTTKCKKHRAHHKHKRRGCAKKKRKKR
jgi:Glucose / Sorbosone dehydrogenase